MTAWSVRQEELQKEQRLALLLADGTGDFDFVRAVAIQNRVFLEGYVKRYSDKERAEELARYVGFATIVNTIRRQTSHDEDGMSGSRRAATTADENGAAGEE